MEAGCSKEPSLDEDLRGNSADGTHGGGRELHTLRQQGHRGQEEEGHDGDE